MKRGRFQKLIICFLALSLCLVSPLGRLGAKAKSTMPLVSGSFLQGWLCRDWSQLRWDQELAAMKELGMNTLVIQSSYDLATTAANSSSYGQDWSKYTPTSRYSLYPTAISELSGAYNSADQLERALIAAKEQDMTVYIGLLSDDRWWRFGWGLPTAPTAGADLTTDSYFADWCRHNGDLSAKMIEEIWGRYGETYGAQIGGFYYYNEVWNFDVACAGTDNGVYATILAENLNAYLKAIEDNCPGKSLMLSPFFNRTLSTGKQYGDFWKAVFDQTNFKEGDIFVPQDCIGEHPDMIDTAPEWIGSLQEAAKTKDGLRFWVNNETFNASYASAPVERVISQIEATDVYAETHLLFSWNHYYNPLVNSSYQTYNDQFAAYLDSRKEPEEAGIEITGFQESEVQGGFRTTYTVDEQIKGQRVTESGLIFGLSTRVSEKELSAGSDSNLVVSYASSQEYGLIASSQGTSTYSMTIAKSMDEPILVRAYARLADGTYVYSEAVLVTA